MSRKPAPVLRECGRTWWSKLPPAIDGDTEPRIGEHRHTCHLTVSEGQPHHTVCRCDCGTHHQRTGQ